MLVPVVTDECENTDFIEILKTIIKILIIYSENDYCIEEAHDLALQIIFCENEVVNVQNSELILKLFNKTNFAKEIIEMNLFERLADLAFDSDEKCPIDVLSKFISSFSENSDLKNSIYEVSTNILWSELPEAVKRTLSERKLESAESYLVFFDTKLVLEEKYPNDLKIYEFTNLWNLIYPNESFIIQERYIAVLLRIWRYSSADFFVEAFNEKFVEDVLNVLENCSDLLPLSFEVFDYLILSFVNHGFDTSRIECIVEFLRKLQEDSPELCEEIDEVLDKYFQYE
ncbi:hypothetical protein TVAG_077820 [Trichomonas vaginalis G3]|uniref:Uncharacterized protein n=1 Tax=Trichomonas vaginalis (strain ATCC PRA-98 / G3) TaxID=412133 RepID=A2FGL6_TRIV3|nr:hypothetical protein TVAGG3_1028360 [Trichomonas vaginalis G3]EAX95940.1 hypothetical protein TVAG_077820 [Trichomonas vaginalis G3]KAI5492672.1 hypothetical protein TVAGG3_1028360 [Trichomonas vaginalis G3]|eukprot:XP_001308870.1 hypothetical protein [Trichomonas vaginalis G3]